MVGPNEFGYQISFHKRVSLSTYINTLLSGKGKFEKPGLYQNLLTLFFGRKHTYVGTFTRVRVICPYDLSVVGFNTLL